MANFGIKRTGSVICFVCPFMFQLSRVTRNDWLSLDDVYSHTLCPGETCVYRKTGNFRVVQFSRNFAVSINPRKLKSAKYFPIFEK